jgi:uncharacterized protein YvpB
LRKYKKHIFVSATISTILLIIITSSILYKSNSFNELPLDDRSTFISDTNYKDLYKDFKRYKKTVQLEVPFLRQYPELPRGCEVTSLAMLFNYNKKSISKLTLAKEIKKDTTTKIVKNGQIYFGNPNEGYVGNMYSLSHPGYGVYIKPIEVLTKKYFKDSTVNLTGKKFEDLKFYISKGNPVWVITNTTFKKLPQHEFETWNTKQGKIKITYKEHSVVITGYDSAFIYINDPLAEKPNKKVPKQGFIDAWVQMGSQALTITSD